MAKNDDYKMTPADAVEVLGSTLEVLRETGLMVGLRNAPAKNERPAGVMIFVSGVQSTADGLAQLPAKVGQGESDG